MADWCHGTAVGSAVAVVVAAHADSAVVAFVETVVVAVAVAIVASVAIDELVESVAPVAVVATIAEVVVAWAVGAAVDFVAGPKNAFVYYWHFGPLFRRKIQVPMW